MDTLQRESVHSGINFIPVTKRVFTFFSLLLIALIFGYNTQAQTLETQFSQGFEVDNSNWFSPPPVRTASGTNGFAASSGGFYGDIGASNTFTRWGGYTTPFPTRGYVTSVDMYLDMSGGYANDTRLAYTSAINNAGGTHRRDFVFSVGFYSDFGPFGTGNRFVMSSSNNSPGDPRDIARSPFVITTTGWYKFRHRFYDSGGGVLAVEMTVLDSSDTVLSTWTLSDPSDIIGTTVGGNRYGWFPANGFPSIAIDNTLRANFISIRNVDDDGMASATDCDAADPAFMTVQSAIDDAGTVAGDLINVCPGTYIEDVNVNKAGLRVIGAGSATTTISGAKNGPGSTVQIAASDVTIAGFTITREGNNVADWDNANGTLNTGGISIQGTTITNALIRDNVFVGNRTAIDINNSSGHTIRNNTIDNNRTGLLFRNQTDNITFVENFVRNNWTMGILFLDASGGTNSPLQQALGSKFNNNDISANWYAQVVERQTGGSLPAPGTTNTKDFRYNWLGTTSPVITTANSTEPGYSALIPVIYGGTATPPGGQPDIAGTASANVIYTPLLTSGTDTNVETTPGRGVNGFQGATSAIIVKPSMLNGWFIYNDENDTINNSLGTFVPGPGTPPLGVGSSQISVTGTQRRNLATYQFSGTVLSTMNNLRYSTYNPSAGNPGSPNRAGYLQFNVDFNGSDTWQRRLIFLPSDNGAVVQDSWQEWDAINGGNALWRHSGATWPAGVGGGGEPGTTTKTWSQVLSQYPGVRIRVTDSFLGIRVGEPYPDGYTENLDAFKFGTTMGSANFNFEPERPTVTINQAGTQLDPTSSTPVNFTVVFSEPVGGFDGSDITLGGTAGATTAVVTGGPTTYNVAASGMTGSGTVTATVVDSAALSTGSSSPSEASTSTDNSVTFFTCNQISTANVNTLTGVPVMIPITTTDTTNRQIIAADFTFTYNPAVMTLAAVPATAGTIWAAANPIVTYFSPTPGTINVSVYGNGVTPDAVGAGAAMYLHFNVIGPIGSTSPLTVSNFLYNGGLQCVDPPLSGTLTVISGTITGNITYANAAVPIINVRGVQLNAPGAPAVMGTSDAAGNYSLSGFGPGSYTVTPTKTRYGFGNSGPATEIFANDASLIAQHVVGITTLNATQLLAAKVSGVVTPNVSSFDAALIAQWIVNINPTSPINQTGKWLFTPTSVNHGVVNANAVQNYTAILLGDVNGSWVNTINSLTAPVLTEPTKESVIASVPRTEAATGSSISVPFRIDNLKGKQITSYQFDIEYDPEVLRAAETGASLVGTNSDGLVVVSNAPQPGLLKVVVYGALPVEGDGVYVNLNFEVLGGVGATTPMTIRGFRFNNGNNEVFGQNGQLTVTEAANNVIRGNLLTAKGQPFGSAGVTLTNTQGESRTVIAGPTGTFEFGDLVLGETYTISVEAKRQKFRPVTVSMTESVIELNMIAN